MGSFWVNLVMFDHFCIFSFASAGATGRKNQSAATNHGGLGATALCHAREARTGAGKVASPTQQEVMSRKYQ